jgi:BirA family biotin operon repressor/biotin-[acetyl-CoA-carboxylase] ligase
MRKRRSDGATERRRGETAPWTSALQGVLDDLGGPLRRVAVLDETPSTQDAALERRAVGGDVVVAARQTAGRGRLGRSWADTAGEGIAVTFVTAAGAAQRLAPAAAVGTARAAEALLGRGVGIKWPNDIVVGGRKLAGILIEQDGVHARIGVGMNVRQASWPAELAGRAVSLAELGGRDDRLDALVALVRGMNDALQLDDDALRCEFRRRDVLAGTRATLRCGTRTVTGTVLECDPQAGLRIRTAGEVVCLPAETTTVVTGSDGATERRSDGGGR